jgi:hypothetical protein
MKLNLKKKVLASKKPSSISPSMEMIGKMVSKGSKK